MKKLLIAAAVLVSLGLVGGMFVEQASAWSIMGPWNPTIPGLTGSNGGCCGPAWCGPVCCGPAYCCPPPPCMKKKKAAKPKAEMKPEGKKK